MTITSFKWTLLHLSLFAKNVGKDKYQKQMVRLYKKKPKALVYINELTVYKNYSKNLLYLLFKFYAASFNNAADKMQLIVKSGVIQQLKRIIANPIIEEHLSDHFMDLKIFRINKHQSKSESAFHNTNQNEKETSQKKDK
ncbi:hypothetical protein RCL_jg1061.t1 [Rhizophagus clarus]|uniref:Uncharacterized protein n=1 Tax=Rhizophagus clarus TaxID=94130 RepID=A0A8H3R5D0_9GLOM|nr:hypothetical protein RCL_jg1061.t1 [Rhizophagus clarus]